MVSAQNHATDETITVTSKLYADTTGAKNNQGLHDVVSALANIRQTDKQLSVSAASATFYRVPLVRKGYDTFCKVFNVSSPSARLLRALERQQDNVQKLTSALVYTIREYEEHNNVLYEDFDGMICRTESEHERHNDTRSQLPEVQKRRAEALLELSNIDRQKNPCDYYKQLRAVAKIEREFTAKRYSFNEATHAVHHYDNEVECMMQRMKLFGLILERTKLMAVSTALLQEAITTHVSTYKTTENLVTLVSATDAGLQSICDMTRRLDHEYEASVHCIRECVQMHPASVMRTEQLRGIESIIGSMQSASQNELSEYVDDEGKIIYNAS